MFPALELNKTDGNIDLDDKWNRRHQLSIRLFEEESHYLINLSRETSDWEDFVREQRVLNQIYSDLCTCSTEKEIYRKVVTWGRNELHLDRIGIILISEDKTRMLGSWGTNDIGEIIDQSYFESSIEEDRWALGAIANRDNVMVRYDSHLKNEGREVGKGWNSLAAFFDGEEPLGWIACDNLLTHSPLPQWKKEILGELARMIGRFVSRFRQETRLQELVDQRTEELRISRDQLIESEKMAALGSLVAGVSHEINTPLGTAITANSFLADQVESTRKQLEDGSLKKSQLLDFFDKISNSRKIISDSLSKTENHISNFKQLATETSSDNNSLFNLKECFSSVLQIMKGEHPEIEITTQFRIDDYMEIYACQSDFILIFNNLIENSYNHGFSSGKDPLIGLSAWRDGDRIFIEYRDNGAEIDEKELENIFMPFYTTGRHLGQAGLGLSIIYNIVYKYKGSVESRSLHPGLSLTFSFTGLTQS